MNEHSSAIVNGSPELTKDQLMKLLRQMFAPHSFDHKDCKACQAKWKLQSIAKQGNQPASA